MSDSQTDNLFRQAVEFQHVGRLDEAEAIYRQILDIEPNSPDVLNCLAIVAQARGNTAAAIDLLRSAISLNPTRSDYHFNLAVLFASDGKTAEA
ncbi:MAG TPA: tetratricopeptide repeat protein, partial [Chloroflexota bacterium]|nr:tetratricopeptide repeat protein [Chloroflexota bacterium]